MRKLFVTSELLQLTWFLYLCSLLWAHLELCSSVFIVDLEQVNVGSKESQWGIIFPHDFHMPIWSWRMNELNEIWGLTMKTLIWRHWSCSGVFLVSFEHVLHFFLVFLLFWASYCLLGWYYYINSCFHIFIFPVIWRHQDRWCRSGAFGINFKLSEHQFWTCFCHLDIGFRNSWF